MSNLKLAPDPDRSIMPAIWVALLVLVTITVIVFLVNPRETASVDVERVQTFAPHVDLKPVPGSAPLLGEQAVSENDLYVVSKLRITDKLRLPIFISSTTVTLVGADGNAEQATAISSVLYPRLQEIFPTLTPLLVGPLRDGDEINPGESREVTVLVLFPNTTEEMWRTKKSATLTIELRNQAPQTVALK